MVLIPVFEAGVARAQTRNANIRRRQEAIAGSSDSETVKRQIHFFEISKLEFRACLGFRYSNFGFYTQNYKKGQNQNGGIRVQKG